jgi:hypothetical protein
MLIVIIWFLKNNNRQILIPSKDIIKENNQEQQSKIEEKQKIEDLNNKTIKGNQILEVITPDLPKSESTFDDSKWEKTESSGVYINNSGETPVVKINENEINDSDKDGISDNIEIKNGTNPNKTDSDEDDLTDLDELNRSTNPLNSDTDGDGYKDGAEINGGFDPLGPGKLKK